MDLKHLRHFVAVVDNGTFLSAARAIPISQPALTRSIQNLEASVNVSLLKRSTRGLELTPQGTQLYRRAKLILSEAQKAKDELQDIEPAQNLRIGVAPLFADNVIPQAISRLARDHPDINLTVTNGLFPELIKQLSEGGIDAMMSNLPFTTLPKELTAEPLLDIDIVYVCSVDHPLAGQNTCEFSDLIQYPWAVIAEEHANDLYSYILASEGFSDSPIKLRTNSLTLLKSTVMQPPYITLMPHHMVMKDIQANRLAIIKTDQANLSRKGGLIYRTSMAEDRLLQIFCTAVRKTSAKI